jgi:DHA1 family tetracycline resistance protein-like MFS transporter
MLTTAALDLLVSLTPSSLPLLVLNGVVTTASNTAFITILRAGLADMFSGKRLGGAHAQAGIAAGVGVVIGPVLGAWITEKFGAAAAYRCAAALGFALAAYTSHAMEETLAVEKRKPMDWLKANPLSFLKLLTSGKEMSALALALGLQCVAEVRYLFPFANLLWLNKGYTPQQVGRFAGLFGVVYVLGAGLAKRRFKRLGPAAHVTESNLCNALAFFVWSRWQGVSGSLAALLIMMGGIRKRDGIEVMITEKGDEKGWGKGETTAITANFKSVSAVLAPTLLARAYASAPGTGAPMFLCAAVTALSEVVFRMR